MILIAYRHGLRASTRALQAWLGHKNIQHTVRYTELSPDRFLRGSNALRQPPDKRRLPMRRSLLANAASRAYHCSRLWFGT
jgi:hypothetical protein